MLDGQVVERRRAVRSRVIKAAQVVSGGSSLDCVAFELSIGGARLHCPATAEMPEQAILRLPDGTSRPAQCRWQIGAESGFEFLAGGRGLLRAVP
jgi:hypothetical protein